MKKKALFWITLVFTLALFTALNVVDKQLKNDVVPNGIVSFQFAKSLDNAVKMIDSWDTDAKIFAAISLGIDYLYLVAYGSFLSLSVLLLAARLPDGFLKKAAGAVVLLIILAALLDGVENYASIRLLTGTHTGSMVSVVYFCAGLKFGLLAVGALYLLAGLAVAGLKKAGKI
ncbi:MAG: hypothetical protein L3J66_01820 [Bacteroidales bacterium]|nr:hypothetical protein [Bacteroidales bacterium]